MSKRGVDKTPGLVASMHILTRGRESGKNAPGYVPTGLRRQRTGVGWRCTKLRPRCTEPWWRCTSLRWRCTDLRWCCTKPWRRCTSPRPHRTEARRTRTELRGNRTEVRWRTAEAQMEKKGGGFPQEDEKDGSSGNAKHAASLPWIVQGRTNINQDEVKEERKGASPCPTSTHLPITWPTGIA